MAFSSLLFFSLSRSPLLSSSSLLFPSLLCRRGGALYSSFHPEELELAKRGCQNVLKNCLAVAPEDKVVLVADGDSPIASLMGQAYRDVMKDWHNNNFVDIKFEQEEIPSISQQLQQLTKGDTVITVQSDAFKLDGYRYRIDLFARGVKVAEHVHLGLMMKEEEKKTYCSSLLFDPKGPIASLSRKIKETVENASKIQVVCKDGDLTTTLNYNTPMEKCNLNLGDYFSDPEKKNIGGTFPVGEVFTEPSFLEGVEGEAIISCFPNKYRNLEIPDKPFKLEIKEGKVVGCCDNTPQSFHEVLEIIRHVEGEDIFVREFGLGVNPAMSVECPLADITAFERQEGMHISLGKKHTVYKKQGIKTRKTRMHIDIFFALDHILCDGTLLFDKEKGGFVV